jgi:secreted trypsin-like serine protease
MTIDNGRASGFIGAMLNRALPALAFSLFLCAPAAALVGGAAPAPDAIARQLVMILGPRGFCTGSVIARDLVLTAAHCVPAGADYKLIERVGANPVPKDIASIARHPQFSHDAYVRHRATADVALARLAAPLSGAQVAALDASGYRGAVGDRLTVAGYGLAARGDGATGGVARMASLIVTGQPGTLQIRLYDAQTRNERAGLGACTGDSGAPAFRDAGGRLAVVGVVSWTTGPGNSDGCGGLTGLTPLVRYKDWIVDTARKLGSALP